MLDLGFVRENLDLVRRKLSERGVPDLLGDFETIDRERRRWLVEAESRKARRNKVSDEIAALKKQKQDASAQIAEMKALGLEIDEFDQKAKVCDEKLREILVRIPNLPHETVPVGGRPLKTGKSDAGESRASLIFSPSRIGNWVFPSAFLISTGRPRSAGRDSPSIMISEPGLNARSPISCWTYTPTCMVTVKSFRPSW